MDKSPHTGGESIGYPWEGNFKESTSNMSMALSLHFLELQERLSLFRKHLHRCARQTGLLALKRSPWAFSKRFHLSRFDHWYRRYEKMLSLQFHEYAHYLAKDLSFAKRPRSIYGWGIWSMPSERLVKNPNRPSHPLIGGFDTLWVPTDSFMEEEKQHRIPRSAREFLRDFPPRSKKSLLLMTFFPTSPYGPKDQYAREFRFLLGAKYDILAKIWGEDNISVCSIRGENFLLYSRVVLREYYREFQSLSSPIIYPNT